jgi:hypothetical protein
VTETTTVQIYKADWKASKVAQDTDEDHKDIIRQWREAYEQLAESEDELEDQPTA